MSEKYSIRFIAYILLQTKEMKEHGYFVLNALIKLGYNEDDLADHGIDNHWINYGYGDRFRARVEEHASLIEDVCRGNCGSVCSQDAKRARECELDIDKIHEMLEDGPGGRRAEVRRLFSELGELELVLKDGTEIPIIEE